MKLAYGYLMATVIAMLGTAAYSQESRGPAPEVSVSQDPGRLTAPIDFWGKGLGGDKRSPSSSDALELGPGRILVRETVWAQPIRTPEGNWMLYVPPKPILDFLENPTEESAKAYLAWKSEQADKMGRAMALLARVKAASSAPPIGESSRKSAESGEDPAARSATLVYFKKPTCPHCVSQDGVLTQWLPKHPEVRADIVLPGERPELWESYGVRGTPTLVLRSTGGREEILVGLQTDPQLEAALKRSSASTILTSTREERERSR